MATGAGRNDLANEWIVCRNRVVLSDFLAVDVKSQNGSKECGQVLTMSHRVVAAAAIAETDVETAIGAKRNCATVVIPERLRNPQNFDLRFRVGHIGIVLRHREPGDNRQVLTRSRGVVHEKLAVFSILRVESKTQQAFFVLIVGVNAAFVDVQKHRRLFTFLIVREDFNYALLLCHEEAIGAIAGMRHDNRAVEVEIWESAFRGDSERLVLSNSGQGAKASSQKHVE